MELHARKTPTDESGFRCDEAKQLSRELGAEKDDRRESGELKKPRQKETWRRTSQTVVSEM